MKRGFCDYQTYRIDKVRKLKSDDKPFYRTTVTVPCGSSNDQRVKILCSLVGAPDIKKEAIIKASYPIKKMIQELKELPLKTEPWISKLSDDSITLSFEWDRNLTKEQRNSSLLPILDDYNLRLEESA